MHDQFRVRLNPRFFFLFFPRVGVGGPMASVLVYHAGLWLACCLVPDSGSAVLVVCMQASPTRELFNSYPWPAVNQPLVHVLLTVHCCLSHNILDLLFLYLF